MEPKPTLFLVEPIVRKTSILFFLVFIAIKNASAICFINNEKNAEVNAIIKSETNSRAKTFSLNQVKDEWIVDSDIDFFVWTMHGTYFFTEYINYSGIGYTREMIVNSLFICSADELIYLLGKNKNHRVSIILIQNPMHIEFLNRKNELLASRLNYIDFVIYYVIESLKNDVTIEILDSWNYASVAKRFIR